MEEKRLSLEAQQLIRGYLLKIAIPSGAMLTLISFSLGYFIQHGAAAQAAKDAFTAATGELVKAVQDIERARTAAATVSAEIEVVRATAKELQSQSNLLVASESLTRIAAAVASDPEFVKLVSGSREVPVVTPEVAQNDDSRPMFIIGFCNASNQSREIEAKAGATLDKVGLVTSTTGTDRLNFSFVVPPGWYYSVRETTSIGFCGFRAWRI